MSMYLNFLQFQSCHHSLISYRIFVNVTDLSEVRRSSANGICCKDELKQCLPSLSVVDPCAARFRTYLKTDHTTRSLGKYILVLNYMLCIPCLKRKGKLSVKRTPHLFQSHVMFHARVC